MGVGLAVVDPGLGVRGLVVAGVVEAGGMGEICVEGTDCAPGEVAAAPPAGVGAVWAWAREGARRRMAAMAMRTGGSESYLGDIDRKYMGNE